MKKIDLIIACTLAVGIAAGSAAIATAGPGVSERPLWITADGRLDFSKLPDDATLPYKCWNGKDVRVSGKTLKAASPTAALDSADHKLGMDKSKELARIPGVVSTDSEGREVIHIDETNPAVVEVMKKYEAKEKPECR